MYIYRSIDLYICRSVYVYVYIWIDALGLNTAVRSWGGAFLEDGQDALYRFSYLYI